jgi:F-type H+-transporting ATPase subunit gamma
MKRISPIFFALSQGEDIHLFLESSFSEQFLRRVAMKNATDASGEMIRELTITYNRVRQAKITNEIAEIVGGAAALE